MVVLDVEGSNAPDRTLPDQLGTRAGLYAMVGEALAAAGVPWDACYREDRGDGLLLLIPPECPKAPLVEVLPAALARAVHEHSTNCPDAARARLRLAVHEGEVAFDEGGVASTSLTTAFRMVDAQPLTQAMADAPGMLAMIVSRVVFDKVVRHCATLDAATFRPVEVTVGEIRDLAWITVLDHPYGPDSAGLNRRPSDSASSTLVWDGRASTVPDADDAELPGAHGPRAVTIVGGVNGAGLGITIGAATGDHFTLRTPPAGESENPR
ncbi:hypothetical protein [Saccharothrix luteola]|uniref:hypothetical protein n=1 Tax=Saccharothrix luteola TaxID=2893018 RepID=UPI001E2EB0D1|nr:hypothetical protein [Saccharothrix luteola]MCC8251189.1 hypothetical protein [Saccharothrix luteola]